MFLIVGIAIPLTAAIIPVFLNLYGIFILYKKRINWISRLLLVWRKRHLTKCNGKIRFYLFPYDYFCNNQFYLSLEIYLNAQK
jgi:hypothetical protein